MKPEKGSEEMEEMAYDPRELFAEVGLLIMEARLPEMSAKGRVEGPHCPAVTGASWHVCDRHKEQCRKASDLLTQQEILWKNQIPMRIDVLLFPDCEHGMREATVVEGATFTSSDHFILLERWDIQMIRKRTPEKLEGFVTGRSLLQAVRSYLHFSQLSSWLISTGGALPMQIVHRAYAPGEVANYSFSILPEVHSFPAADLGEVVMRSTVSHYPRQNTMITLPCKMPKAERDYHRVRKTRAEQRKKLSVPGGSGKGPFPSPSTSTSGSANVTDGLGNQLKKSKQKRQTKDNKNSDFRTTHTITSQQVAQKPPSGKKPCDRTPSEEEGLEADSSTSSAFNIGLKNKRKVDQLSPSVMELDKYSQRSPELKNLGCHDNSSKSPGTNKTAQKMMMSGAKPAKPPTTLSLPYTESGSVGINAAASPGQLSPQKQLSGPGGKKALTLPVSMATNSNVLTKRLPSPKVLFTGSRKPEPSVYKKRCLDLSTPSSDDNDSLSGFEELDDFQEFVKPLSPSQLEAYLSSLSNKAPRKVSQLAEIPTTKCKFYIGEATDQTESETKPDSRTCETDISQQSQKLSEGQTTLGTPQTSQRRKAPVASLFRKSYSTSEVEDDLTSSRCDSLKFGEETVGKDLQDFSDDVFQRSVESDKSVHSHCDKTIQRPCDKNQEDDLQNQCQTSLHMHKSAQKRELTLDDISIPCKVGAVTTALTSLIQNLESMEIDEKSKHTERNGVSLETNGVSHSTNGVSLETNGVSSESTLATNSKSENSSNEHKSAVKPEDAVSQNGFTKESRSATVQQDSTRKSISLCKQLLKKELEQNAQNETFNRPSRRKNLPSADDVRNFHCHMGRSTSAVFSSSTGLPTRSSPAPIKRKSSSRFDYDCTLTNVRAIKNALSCSKLTLQSENKGETIQDQQVISASAPASTNCLLGNFEESMLNGRIEPVGVVDGFTVEIGAGGTFCPKHVTLPVAAYFFQLSDDNAPSPYLGHISLDKLGRRGYHIPRSGTVQVTLFNPNKTVVKMFVVMYDLTDMPANCQTFLRQRTMYLPVDDNSMDPSFLRYLIHLRFASSKSGKIYLHTDIRLIFARDKFEFDPRVANYELRSFTEGPHNPKFSPKR